nr:hypothetical protein [Tanacetum cinerariifolium]
MKQKLWQICKTLQKSMLGIKCSKKLATVEDFVLLHEDKIYSESKTRKVSSSTKKKGRNVAITAEDIQKRKNDSRQELLFCWPSLINIS